MNVVDTVRMMGGIADASAVVAAAGRRRTAVAVRDGLIRKAGSKLILPEVHSHLRRAVELSGVVSHLSAAQALGLPVVHPPREPWVTVPRHRYVRAATRGTHLSYADLDESDVVEGCTAPLRTVIDCARKLPFAEALAVADSALREGLLTYDELEVASLRLRGRGAPQARAVAASASGLAANPFESSLRAIALGISLLRVEPQGEVELHGFSVAPDLVDRSLMLAIEADSWEFHTSKKAHEDDCERFTLLGLEGWLVLRFSWEQVTFRADYVEWALRRAATLRAARMA